MAGLRSLRRYDGRAPLGKERHVLVLLRRTRPSSLSPPPKTRGHTVAREAAVASLSLRKRW